MKSANTIAEQVSEGCGFYLGLKLQEAELQQVLDCVREQWLEKIKEQAPAHWQQFSERGIERYHELAHLLNHGATWPKAARILPQKTAGMIRKTSLMRNLERVYGHFEISDEDNVGREEIYWRLVRPNQSSDVGPLHADAWFWDLGHGQTPANTKRVKVWIALCCEPGLNGLRIVPESHKKQWKYHGEYRDGFSKPQIDEKEEDLNVQLVHTVPGDAIVFHDRLLHGGAVNKGSNTRVSMEFTMFVKECGVVA